MNQFLEKYFEKVEVSDRTERGFKRIIPAATDSAGKRAVKLTLLMLLILLGIYFISVMSAILMINHK